MLRFVGCASGSGATSYGASEVIQVVDLRDYHDEIAVGGRFVRASGFFNRVAGDAETDTEFGLALYAFSGDPNEFRSLWGGEEISESSAGLLSDADRASWEQLTALMALHTDTDFVALRIFARENLVNDTTGIELDGHYGDAFSLEIVPEPTGMLLLAVGFGAMVLSRRRKLEWQDR